MLKLNIYLLRIAQICARYTYSMWISRLSGRRLRCRVKKKNHRENGFYFKFRFVSTDSALRKLLRGSKNVSSKAPRFDTIFFPYQNEIVRTCSPQSNGGFFTYKIKKKNKKIPGVEFVLYGNPSTLVCHQI